MANAGCRVFVIHARKAWLKGLSPKQNRDVPPLNYEIVYQLKADFPELEIIINGGINDLEQCQQHLAHVDGVMMGREAYSNPFILSQVDELLYQQEGSLLTRDEVMQGYIEYVEQQMQRGVRLNHLSKHVIGLFHGEPRARLWRRFISENAHLPNADADVLRKAYRAMVG